MRTRWFISRLVLALLPPVLAACGGDATVPPPAPAPEFGHFRWPSFPVDLELDTTLLENEARHRDLKAAVLFWERHAGKKLFRAESPWEGPGLPFTGPADRPDSISTNALLFGAAGTLESNIAGLTSLRVENETITGAVILVDPDTHFCSGLCESENSTTSLRRLLAHELGHFLGLGHSSDPENVMYPSIRPGGSLRDRTVDEETLHRLTN